MRNIHLTFDHERCKFLRANAFAMAMERDEKYPDNKGRNKLQADLQVMDIEGFTYSLLAYHSVRTVTVKVTSRQQLAVPKPGKDAANLLFE